MVSFCWLSSNFSCDSCMVCEPLLCSYKCLFALTFLAEGPDYFEGDSGQRSLCIPARKRGTTCHDPIVTGRAFPSSHHHFLRLSRKGQGPNSCFDRSFRRPHPSNSEVFFSIFYHCPFLGRLFATRYPSSCVFLGNILCIFSPFCRLQFWTTRLMFSEVLTALSLPIPRTISVTAVCRTPSTKQASLYEVCCTFIFAHLWRCLLDKCGSFTGGIFSTGGALRCAPAIAEDVVFGDGVLTGRPLDSQFPLQFFLWSRTHFAPY